MVGGAYAPDSSQEAGALPRETPAVAMSAAPCLMIKEQDRTPLPRPAAKQNATMRELTVCRNRLINLLVEVQPMELLVHHRSAPKRRPGNQGSSISRVQNRRPQRKRTER